MKTLQKFQQIGYKGRSLAVVVESGETEQLTLETTQLVVRCPTDTEEKRLTLLIEKWLQEELRKEIESLVKEWETTLDVEVSAIFYRRMSEKWGRCDHKRRILWFHPELIGQSQKTMERVVAEQMIHLLEPTKNQCFVKLMDFHHPDWNDSPEP